MASISRPIGKAAAARLMGLSALRQAGLLALISLVVCLRPAGAMQPCPPDSQLLSNAKIVVEARVRSFSIGDSGFLVEEGVPTRMVRAELEIEKVIKGKFPKKEAILYGGVFPPGPIRELVFMAAIFGLGEEDIFEVELSRQELAPGVEYFSLGSCIYTKFPELVTELTRTEP